MDMGGQKPGFTIVELLIVIVVIAVLAVIGVVAYRGISSRAYLNRATSELSYMARSVKLYHTDRARYPDDVERNIPVEIFDYSGSSVSPRWPEAPWPGSIYDYDYFIGSDGREVSQISVRFCPISGPIEACHFPREPWANNFDVQSSVYWCIAGSCRAHPNMADDHPGYCINCQD